MEVLTEFFYSGINESFSFFSDPPKILSVGPDRLTTAMLFTSATFECVAEGNPQPTYQWLQRLPTPSDIIVERGRDARLHIPNVTYEYQGEYVCKVTNIIGGQERTVQSESIALQVVGKLWSLCARTSTGLSVLWGTLSAEMATFYYSLKFIVRYS